MPCIKQPVMQITQCRFSHMLPNAGFWEAVLSKLCAKSLILLVGAPRFELGTPSPPVMGGSFLVVSCPCRMSQKYR
jgi:hypothetical protein